MDLWIAGGDGVADLLHQHGLAGARRRHDQPALAPADRAQQVHDPQAHVTVIRLQDEHRLRVDDREILERGALLGLVGLQSIDGFHGGQRQPLGTAVGHPRLAGDLAPFQQVVGADHPRRHEDIPVRLPGLEVVVLRLPQPAGSVLAKLKDPGNRFGRALDLRNEVRTRFVAAPAALAAPPSFLTGSSAGLGRSHPFR